LHRRQQQPISTPMMAITTSNSIRVNANRREERWPEAWGMTSFLLRNIHEEVKKGEHPIFEHDAMRSQHQNRASASLFWSSASDAAPARPTAARTIGRARYFNSAAVVFG
jgi:hypothetical protein